MLSKEVCFEKALPVWASEFIDEMNITLRLGCKTSGKKENILRISANSCYQIFLDNKLFAMGPARAGHGYYRVDEWNLRPGDHNLKILVAGYNNNAFQYVDELPFICAELICDGEITAYTDEKRLNGFSCRQYNERIQKCVRFSFQRNFSESYDFVTPASTDRLDIVRARNEEINFIERGVPYYENDYEPAVSCVAIGKTKVSDKLEYPWMDRTVAAIGPQLKGYKLDELTINSVWEAQKFSYEATSTKAIDLIKQDTVSIPKNGFATFQMEKNLTGVIGFDIETKSECTVYATFDELCGENGDVNFLRLGTSSVISWKLPKGEFSLLSFEPYVLKFLKITVIGSDAKISNVHIRRVGFYKPDTKVKTDNPKIKAVFDAAMETFRQNTYDIYMDCASRERAGWLCDSFFTSRVEYALTGKSVVERNFLENFLQPDSFKKLPKGMLPMCYPSDHYDGVFIPNWAMWYVVELEEYLARSNDRELIEKAKPRVYDLLNYFRKFENKDGLLEKLESWVFVEWSKSNDLVQDVNFPSNMLYAKMKRAIANIYNDTALLPEADNLSKKIKELSYNGKFFCDNLVYENGKLVPSGMCTESCQYYAFHTGVATPEEYPELWEILLHDFGPKRKENNKYPEIFFANAFIGNYLRLDLLDRFGYTEEIMDNIEGYFFYMAEKTGTLWENDTVVASCNHGFASHVIYWLKHLGMLEIRG